MLQGTKAVAFGAAVALVTSAAVAAPNGKATTAGPSKNGGNGKGGGTPSTPSAPAAPKPPTYASSPVTFALSDIGKSANVLFAGHVGGQWEKAISAAASFSLNSVSADGKSWTFGYSLTNTSTAQSRLRSFGFDLSGGAAASASGLFGNVDGGDNFPESFGRVNTCFKASANGQCTGGQGGLWNTASAGANSASGTFLVRFATQPTSLTLDRFVTRFQSITGVPGGSSGIGVGTVQTGAVVPEPATWAMMIAGFGLVGAALRSRRRPLAAA